MSPYNQQWFPWQGGNAPASSPSNHSRQYQYLVPSSAYDPLDALKKEDMEQAGEEAHKPESRNRRQDLGTLGSALQSSLPAAATAPNQVTPKYPGATQPFGIRDWRSHTGFLARPPMQPGAVNQYSVSGSNYTALPQSTSVNLSSPRAFQEQTLQPGSSSLKYGQNSRGALKMQRLALDPDIPYDSPADPKSLKISSSSSKSIATPSSLAEESHSMNKVAKQRKCRPMRNHKLDSAEKHYLETRDGQLYHKMGQETEWCKSTSRATSTA